ncbi:Pro-interleukin-16 Interleukin-16 [Channa argus]|uniref:Pro-interleukin-16 Interleukin-16 n=1 Tax=Channa argus TaxID=215402 RepID=A0A6G1PNM5_CHAAH|nr:Pro-interleukin-16 Interleukin-16 [Channa argus]
MDLSLLTTSASEYNKQKRGAQFTVRPANSPFYSLTHRSDVRKPMYFADEKGEHLKEAQKRERYVTHTGANGTNEEDTGAGYHDCTRGHSSVKNQCEEKETSTKQSHNDTTNTEKHKLTEFGTDRSGNPAFESCGRTESKKSDFLNRSKSLGWRAGTRQFDFGTGADMLSTKEEKQAGELDEKRREVHSMKGKLASSLKGYNSSGTSNVIQERSPVSQTLDRADWGHSLPSRLKSQSGSKFTETSFSPRGGQTIVERIEKLYGSAGFGKVEDYNRTKDVCASVTITDLPKQNSVKCAEGGTFPRRSSSGEKNSLSPGKALLWTLQKDAWGAHNSLSAGRSRRLSDGQWQDQMGYSCEGGISSGKELEEVPTRSLDRALARATARVAAHPEPTIQSFSTEEASVYSKDSSGLRESIAIERKDRSSRANHRESRGECKKINGAKEAENGAKEKAEFKCSNTHEDVFESNSQEIASKSPDRNKFQKILSAPSTASVRNKINQFEALSHRAQGLGTQPFLTPRRAFSVPTQLGAAPEGEKMSGSAKTVSGLKDMLEGRTIYKSQNKAAEAAKKLASERSLSVDFVRVGGKEREVKDLFENEETKLNAGKNSGEEFGKYSKLRHALEIPLNVGAQRRCENFYIDETDFSRVLSPEEESKRDKRANRTPPMFLSSDTSGSVQKTNPSVVTSPASDDDTTPTNTPNNSPFLSPTALMENDTPNADTTCVFKQTAQTPRADSQPLPHPLATSSLSNIPALISSPDVNTGFPKDLNEWVAGLNSEIKVWNDDENDYEDDDDDDTQKDEDSNYDSDSGESSVTITSNMSQSDRRSFCVSLSDLCNYAGADYESENDSDEWQSTGRRSVSLSSDVSALSCVSVMPSEELDRLLEDVRTGGDNTLQDCDDVQVVVLHKEVGAGLGFSVAGGVDQNKPVTVHKVFHSGVAAQEGSISEGDQVLSINGTALCGYAHREALGVLRRAKSREMGVVVLRKGDVIGPSKSGIQRNNQGPTQTLFTKSGQNVCVVLEKNSRDLGFTLEGGVGSSLGNRPLTIQKIFQGGPLDKVHPGDELLEIKGGSTVGMTRLEAWTLIRKLHPGPVDVVLRCPHEQLET